MLLSLDCNHLDVLMADVFCHCGCLWPFLMADDIAFVADGIATFVLTAVIVIAEMENHFV